MKVTTGIHLKITAYVVTHLSLQVRTHTHRDTQTKVFGVNILWPKHKRYERCFVKRRLLICSARSPTVVELGGVMSSFIIQKSACLKRDNRTLGKRDKTGVTNESLS